MASEVLSRIMELAAVNMQASNLMSLESSAMKSTVKLKTSSYKCDKCRDTGWIFLSPAEAAPIVTSCGCRELEKLKNQWSQAGINPENSSQTFSSFEVWNEDSRKAKQTAATYYKNFAGIRKDRRNSILLCGQSGSGKTHLSVALAFNFLDKGIRVVYMPYRDVMTKIKQNMLDNEYYKKEISKYQTCEILLVDDLFKGKLTDSDINIVFEILNYRYLNYLPVIISTEFTVERLLSFDEAIGSRIYEMCRNFIVEIDKTKENNYRLR